MAQAGKEPVCNAGDMGLIPGLERSPGEGNGNPLWYSSLENTRERGAWWAAVQRVAKRQTCLSTQTSIHCILYEFFSDAIIPAPTFTSCKIWDIWWIFIECWLNLRNCPSHLEKWSRGVVIIEKAGQVHRDCGASFFFRFSLGWSAHVLRVFDDPQKISCRRDDSRNIHWMDFIWNCLKLVQYALFKLELIDSIRPAWGEMICAKIACWPSWLFTQVMWKKSESVAIPWTVACQAPLSVGFSRQEYWSG